LLFPILFIDEILVYKDPEPECIKVRFSPLALVHLASKKVLRLSRPWLDGFTTSRKLTGKLENLL